MDALPDGKQASQMRLQARQKYKSARKISMRFSGLFLIGMTVQS
jgi:hypothetical protein